MGFSFLYSSKKPPTFAPRRGAEGLGIPWGYSVISLELRPGGAREGGLFLSLSSRPLFPRKERLPRLWPGVRETLMRLECL